MRQFRYFALALVLGAFFSLSAYAQKGGSGNAGDPGLGGKENHFGLSDSCWKVFLAGLSASDAAKLTADQTTIAANEVQIDTFQSQINALFRASGKGTRPDSATLAKVRVLEGQIQTLNQADGALQMEIGGIIKANNTLLATVEENCGRPPRDTSKGGGKGDTSKGGPIKIGNPRGHFGLSDSCWNIFLSQISTTDAAGLAADEKTIETNEAQIDTLERKIHDLLKNGGGKDSTIRNEVKALLAQIQTLRKATLDAAKDYAAIIKKNEAILQSIRQDCGRVKHKGNAGDPGNGLTVTDIVPNPASVGGSISFTIGLTSDAEVEIFASLIGPQGPPSMLIFNGKLPAGSTPETIALGRLGAGAYLITIQSGNSSVQKKLVIQ